MPDDRRNKANSYRGCAFFAYKGVKLDKMFKEALKAKEHADLAQDKEEDEKETNTFRFRSCGYHKDEYCRVACIIIVHQRF